MPGRNGRDLENDMKENVCSLDEVSLNFIPEGPSDNKSALAQVMVWCLTDGKQLPEPMFTNIYRPYGATRPQWVNISTA